ncbi:gluconokinase [Mycetocola reblochoni]|nr:gluconokinase [Mycetocola reblochoni]RLP68415.1 gluconokinase [Mycetocola reblochoni]
MSLHSSTPVLIVMGVSGSGKSTLASGLSTTLGWDFLEGDEVHPAANVAKMAAGTPLTDEDRWPWLRSIRRWIDEHQAAGTPGVVTCSSLKRSYRDVLAANGVVFVHPTGDERIIATRMAARTGHYMPASLLASQLATLEPLQPDENAIAVDVSLSPAEQLAFTLDHLAAHGVAVPLDPEGASGTASGTPAAV